MCGTVPKDVGEGVWPLITDQEHALIGLVRVAEVVISIVDETACPLWLSASATVRSASSSGLEGNGVM